MRPAAGTAAPRWPAAAAPMRPRLRRTAPTPHAPGHAQRRGAPVPTAAADRRPCVWLRPGGWPAWPHPPRRQRARGPGPAQSRGARLPAAAGSAAPAARRPASARCTSGSALPVMAVCCSATRIAASTSASTFSSRERDSDWISSSSCERCKVASATRASSSAIFAAASRAVSCACLASNWRGVGHGAAVFLALDQLLLELLDTLLRGPGQPNGGSAQGHRQHGHQPHPAPGGRRRGLARRCSGGGWAWKEARSLNLRLYRPARSRRQLMLHCRNAQFTQGDAAETECRARAAMRGCEAMASPCDQSAAGASPPRLDTASELLKSHSHCAGRLQRLRRAARARPAEVAARGARRRRRRPPGRRQPPAARPANRGPARRAPRSTAAPSSRGGATAAIALRNRNPCPPARPAPLRARRRRAARPRCPARWSRPAPAPARRRSPAAAP